MTPIHSETPIYSQNRKYYKTDKEVLPKYPREDQTSEIIHVRKRGTKWSSTATYVTNVQIVCHSRSIGGYGDNLDNAMVVGTTKSFYEFDVEKREWIDYTQGFNIGNSFSIDGESIDIQQFKPWLIKTYDNFYKSSKISELSAIEGDMAPGCNSSQSSSYTTNIETSKDTKSSWNKFISNVKSFAISSQPSRIRNQSRPPKRLLRNQMFCKNPTTWTLRKRNLDYFWHPYGGHYVTRRKVEQVESRYIVFRMKNHIYFTGGYISPNDFDKNEKYLRFDKYNLNEHRWTKCEYHLPYTLQHASVVVSSDQTCAIFTGGQKNRKKRVKPGNRIIIFEEETGFTLLEEKMLRRRANDLSMILPV